MWKLTQGRDSRYNHSRLSIGHGICVLVQDEHRYLKLLVHYFFCGSMQRPIILWPIIWGVFSHWFYNLKYSTPITRPVDRDDIVPIIHGNVCQNISNKLGKGKWSTSSESQFQDYFHWIFKLLTKNKSLDNTGRHLLQAGWASFAHVHFVCYNYKWLCN